MHNVKTDLAPILIYLRILSTLYCYLLQKGTGIAGTLYDIHSNQNLEIDQNLGIGQGHPKSGTTSYSIPILNPNQMKKDDQNTRATSILGLALGDPGQGAHTCLRKSRFLKTKETECTRLIPAKKYPPALAEKDIAATLPLPPDQVLHTTSNHNNNFTRSSQ